MRLNFDVFDLIKLFMGKAEKIILFSFYANFSSRSVSARK